jgi:cupin fold WbuC family metalloprotein
MNQEPCKFITNETFALLAKEAAISPRKRMNKNFHVAMDETVQRMIVSVEESSYVRPHRHIGKDKWELFVLLKGAITIFLFNEDGKIIDKIDLGEKTTYKGIEIPPRQFHSLVALENGSAFLEIKQGPYTPFTAKNFPEWAPEEGSSEAVSMPDLLRVAAVGDQLPFSAFE